MVDTIPHPHPAAVRSGRTVTAKGRLGRDTVAEDVEVERRFNALKRMEEDMDLPFELRVTEKD